MSPLAMSLLIASIATLINFFLGVFLASCVMKMNKARSLVDGFLSLSMVLPPTVVGFFLLSLLGRQGPLGRVLESLGIQVIFTPLGGIISAVVVSLPLMYRTSLGAFEQVDKEVLAAARTLGLDKYKIFWKILVPLSMPGLISGLILTFTRSLGEFGATIMLAGNIRGKTQTMSTAIYTAVQAGDTHEAMKWSLIIVIISFIMMVLMNALSKSPGVKLND